MILPALLVLGGAAALIALASSPDDRDVPVHEPDQPPSPGHTGYRRVDAILDDLRAASESSQIPLGLLVGWIAAESGGRLDERTKYDERGYFQLMPAESKSLGIDHQRLSTDSTYSINAGLLLIGKYMHVVDGLDVATRGSSYYWKLVKLAHTMGSGALAIIIAGAKAVGAAGSWDALERHAIDNEDKYLHSTKHSPSKWFPLVDKVVQIGLPFGFGSADVVVGEALFPDIVDPLDVIQPRQDRHASAGSA